MRKPKIERFAGLLDRYESLYYAKKVMELANMTSRLYKRIVHQHARLRKWLEMRLWRENGWK